MPVRSWFPTLIYDAPLLPAAEVSDALRAQLLVECRQLREMDDEGREWCAENYPTGYTSYASYCHMQRMSSTFAELQGHLDKHIAAFARSLQFDLDGRELAMTDCWVNVMPRHAVHGLHLHPTATISGTYYVATPPDCSSIKFEDPRLASYMAAPPRKATVRSANRTFVHYTAEAGHVILFESWLRHEVPQSRVDEERVSISFNYNWF